MSCLSNSIDDADVILQSWKNGTMLMYIDVY